MTPMMNQPLGMMMMMVTMVMIINMHSRPTKHWRDHSGRPARPPSNRKQKIQSDSVKCCWVCVPCQRNEYLFNETKCEACEKGWWPNGDQTGCRQIPIRYLDWRSMEALTAISIACFGLLLTLLVAIVFLKHNETPVVKSSTRELSYMILIAMLLCYANTFVLIAKPTKATCFLARILPGFAFSMLYGALVTKTNRIARILAGSKKKIITRKPYFMSATAQVAITWLIVLIECLIIVGMLIKEPPDKMLAYPSDERVLLVCNTTTMGIIGEFFVSPPALAGTSSALPACEFPCLAKMGRKCAPAPSLWMAGAWGWPHCSGQLLGQPERP